MVRLLLESEYNTRSGLNKNEPQFRYDLYPYSHLAVVPPMLRTGCAVRLFDDPNRQAFAFTEQLVRDPAPEETFFP